jgi:hypothetical protein
VKEYFEFFNSSFRIETDTVSKLIVDIIVNLYKLKVLRKITKKNGEFVIKNWKSFR